MSSTFERILVPTDLTDFTDAAMAHAFLFQDKLGSKVTMLHADEISWLAAEHPVGYYIDHVPEAKRELQERLAAFALRYAGAGRAITTHFIDDQPAHAICVYAEEMDADLIVMATHARRGLSRAVLGSVTQRVLRDTTRPVLTVVPAAIPSASLRSVLCPVNFTPVARRGLEQAAIVAEAFGAQLIVMHVLEGEPPVLSHVDEEFAAWVDPLVQNRTRYDHIFAHGNAAARVVETAELIGASLIVVGAEHKWLVDRTVIGTSTGQIIRNATRPVLTVIHREAAEARQVA